MRASQPLSLDRAKAYGSQGVTAASAQYPDDEFIMQVLRPNGVQCLWLFRRIDGSFFYVNVSIFDEDDQQDGCAIFKCRSCSEAFASIEEAQRDARNTLSWVRNLSASDRDSRV